MTNVGIGTSSKTKYLFSKLLLSGKNIYILIQGEISQSSIPVERNEGKHAEETSKYHIQRPMRNNWLGIFFVFNLSNFFF